MIVQPAPPTAAADVSTDTLWLTFQALPPADRARFVADLIAGTVKRVPQ